MGKRHEKKHFTKEDCCCLITKSCQILCNPMDCSSPHSPVHGIFPVRILEWVAISFSRGFFLTQGSNPVSLTLADGFFPTELPGTKKNM